jgi:hypothetical protein
VAVAVRTSIALLGWLALSGCSSDEGVADQRQPGDASAGAAGIAGSGAAAGSGGASGSSGAGGGGGSAGAEPACPGYCSTLAATSCTGGKDETSCVAFCDAIVAVTEPIGCGAETEAVFTCYGAQPAAGYSCDPNGEPVLPVGACQSENDAIDACLCDSGCAAIVAAGCPNTDQASCVQFCAALRIQCPACNDSLRALLICEAGLPTSSFQCNAQGAAELVPPACAQQLQDHQDCVAVQCPAP